MKTSPRPWLAALTAVTTTVPHRVSIASQKISPKKFFRAPKTSAPGVAGYGAAPLLILAATDSLPWRCEPISGRPRSQAEFGAITPRPISPRKQNITPPLWAH